MPTVWLWLLSLLFLVSNVVVVVAVPGAAVAVAGRKKGLEEEEEEEEELLIVSIRFFHAAWIIQISAPNPNQFMGISISSDSRKRDRNRIPSPVTTSDWCQHQLFRKFWFFGWKPRNKKECKWMDRLLMITLITYCVLQCNYRIDYV